MFFLILPFLTRRGVFDRIPGSKIEKEKTMEKLILFNKIIKMQKEELNYGNGKSYGKSFCGNMAYLMKMKMTSVKETRLWGLAATKLDAELSGSIEDLTIKFYSQNLQIN